MRRRLFELLIVLQALVLVGWAVRLETVRVQAETIRLEAFQRDPRDLLRGDYIRLNYRIADIPASAFAAPPERARPGDRVWVALARRGDVWVLAAASLQRDGLRLDPDQRLIVGTIQRASRQGVHAFYGIEDYYVREGKGRPPRGRMEAQVSLTREGQPLLTRLYVNGRPYP